MARPEKALLRKTRELYKQTEPDDLINHNMRLALYLAEQYQDRAWKKGIEWQDLQGQALLTLVEAANNYPNSKAAKKNIPFKAYLDRAIKTQTLTMLSKASLAHGPSYRVYKSVRDLTKMAAALQAQNEREHVTEKELAEALNWPLEKVRDYQRYFRALMNYVEFSRPIAGLDGEKTFGDILPDDSNIEEQIINEIDLKKEARWLSEATADLPHITRVAIYLVFGLPIPEKVKNPTFGEVLRVAMNYSASASRGIKQLREIRRNEKGDAPELGKQDTSIRFGCRRSKAAVGGKQERNRAADFWKRASREKWFPRLQKDKPARKMGVG